MDNSDVRSVALDLKITPEDIDNDIIRQPGLYAYYAAQLATAKRTLSKMTLDLDVYEAAVNKRNRDVCLAKGEKPTEKMLETLLRLDAPWLRRSEAKIDAEATVNQLESVVRAFAQKKDMLITYASNLRAERSASFAMRGDRNLDVPANIEVTPYNG